ncbi:preprotein translocase subunit SecE [Desulfovibrio sp. An276]|uniref:preprotein translocase subunit SecE n=1 Tax=Desulfovibrio sp. An276 TaxID=1965618 RepID=UPI000B37661A|nr:preprotein translocase subunit SecE [Desulfovibrio sp. An276]OUO55078.1 preprotein translocase subunit SecE [Desulfovibrio sp. An276]
MAKKTAQAPKAQEPKVEQPNPVQRFMRYVEDSRAELRKVTWPTVAETRKATFAVLGFVAVMAVILGLVDLGLSSIIKSFLS